MRSDMKQVSRRGNSMRSCEHLPDTGPGIGVQWPVIFIESGLGEKRAIVIQGSVVNCRDFRPKMHLAGSLCTRCGSWPASAALSFCVDSVGRAPRFLFADNGSEFSGRLLDMWAYHYKVQIDFSRPGKPTDNSFIETFNGSFRDECLNLHWFESLAEARREIEAWRRDYNETRPHMALNDLTPGEFARQYSLRPTTEGS